MSGSSSSSSDDVTFKVEPDPGLTLTFNGMAVSDELGRPFDAQLDVSSASRSGDLVKMLGCSATITVKLPGGGKRYFNGIIARALFTGMSGGAYHYRMELRPWIWLLSRRRDNRIYQNKSAWDIITSVFRDDGFTDFEDHRQSQSGDIVLDYCVQYDETNLDFVTRLMEKYGIYYSISHQDGRHSLVFADDPNAHSSVGAAIPYRYQQTDQRRVDDHIWEWSSDLQLQPGMVTLRDYNFETPQADLTAKSNQPSSHPHGNLEYYLYPGPYLTAADGQKVAAVRMQEFASRGETVRGSTNARGIFSGCKFTLSNNPDTSQNREYLVIATRATFTLNEGRAATTGGDQLDQYVCTFTAIPGSTTFRLDPITAAPRMRGPQTARVVGESGEEITTDKYARIKVKFFWDRSSVTDENASCWIRVAQSWAGVSFGGMVIPRIGQEVIVDFLDGNPDRPIVTGCVYNATTTVPYAQPDNKTRSTFKTNSSTGGGGFNELRFEDKKGSEEVFLQAQYDFNINVLNNQTATVKKDRTTTVQEGDDSLTVSQGKRSVTVSQGDDEHTVSQGKRTVTVSTGDDSLTVSTGNQTITISAGSSTISAGQSITLKVGSNSLVIDTSGITVNGAKIGLSGTGAITLQAPSIALN